MATKQKEPTSYKEAMEELEEISTFVQDRNVDVDVLSEKVKRAHLLIKFCQERVDSVRFEIDNIFNDEQVEQDETF